jgi:hypothetical protein
MITHGRFVVRHQLAVWIRVYAGLTIYQLPQVLLPFFQPSTTSGSYGTLLFLVFCRPLAHHLSPIIPIIPACAPYPIHILWNNLSVAAGTLTYDLIAS